MKLAVITDSSAYLPASLLENENLFVLDIPVVIDGESYVEGRNLTASEFYEKMAQSDELPKTSQPSIADLEEILTILDGKHYTHVLGLFLSSGISGFYQNIQYLSSFLSYYYHYLVLSFHYYLQLKQLGYQGFYHLHHLHLITDVLFLLQNFHRYYLKLHFH